MNIKVGCDIVSTQRFTTVLNGTGTEFLHRVFLPHELARATSTHSLMGIFAAKEAVLKALELPPGSWLSISINKEPNGKPSVHILDFDSRHILSSDISITHEQDYACAVCCFLLT